MRRSHAYPAGVGQATSFPPVAEVPGVSVDYYKLVKLRRADRIRYIAKQFAVANISAFASAAIMHRLLDYGFDALAPKSEKAHAAKDIAHSLINLYEADKIVRSLVKVERPPMDCSYFDQSEEVRNHIRDYMREAGLVSEDAIVDIESYDGYCYDSLSFKDLCLALMDLSPKVSSEFGIDVLYKERVEESKEDSYLFFVKTTHTFGILAERQSIKYGDYDIYGESMRITLFTDRKVGLRGEAMNALSPMLTRVIRANFLAQLNPEKNLIELENHVTRVVLRKESLDRIPNIDVDEIKHSIATAIKHKKRRVISIVGDAGLGKTEAMHSIVNAFPSVPTFIVTPSASGTTPSAASIKAIFDAVKVVESIVVFDDFEGFDVSDKNPITNEFLRQLSGSSGFNGIALLIVNDPSKVNPLIINRPGRTDSVYAVDYLSSFEDVVDAIRQKFGADLDASFNEPIVKMTELKFSTARINRAYEFAVEHFGDSNGTVSPDQLLEAVKRVDEFEKIALSRAVRGRLVYGEEAAAASDSDRPRAVNRRVDLVEQCRRVEHSPLPVEFTGGGLR